MRFSRRARWAIIRRYREPGFDSMNFTDASDDSLLAYYESIRRQVAADTQSRGRPRLVSANAREHADRLKEEIMRRRLVFKPIEWPSP
jgi:hypothetical protein